MKEDVAIDDGDAARRAAQFDRLTGLLNRRAFDERAEAYFGHGGVRPTIVALWDVDYLKAVNDFHGHRIGDQVLRHVAGRLSMALGAPGVLARVGGDEFAALLLETSAADAMILFESAASAVREALDGTTVAVTVTCGVAVPFPAETWPHPWQRADEALYNAKRQGRGGIGFSERR
ncbi:MAG TPA: GGDEF domain-containing protein [Candidatus Dormibacteraeota bacterium]